jgi:hypothetical protein
MAGHGSPPPPDRGNDPSRRVARPDVDPDDAWERPQAEGTVQTSGWDDAEANPRRIGPYSF